MTPLKQKEHLMENKQKVGCGLGCLSTPFIIYLIIRLILAGTRAASIEATADAKATTEASCHFVGNATEYVNQTVCLRGPILNVTYSPRFIIKFGYPDNEVATNLIMKNKIVATSDDYYIEGLEKEVCIHIWGTLSKNSDGILELKIDPSIPIETYSNVDC
jgi:hypothetical protein